MSKINVVSVTAADPDRWIQCFNVLVLQYFVIVGILLCEELEKVKSVSEMF